ncbi:MAG: rhomboid family intramembrane serine protease [Actinomycetota bacterium]|nr:rhomboid family intramembrane serine protease [Actinomycetota bacterium]
MPGAPDLFVVCKNCRNEVSPYITECPYCGTRLRKRAPKIERDGRVSDKGRRPRRRTTAPRLSKLRAGEIPGVRGERTGRPWATLSLVVLSLFGYLLLFAVNQGDVALVGDPGRQWWRIATTPFLYGNAWYELAAVGAIGLFGWLLERRHGPWPVLALFVVCGMGGAALEAVIDPLPIALGGNGAGLGMLCAWAIPDVVARSREEDYEGDLLGAAVIGLVLLLMPLAVDEASAIAGFAGGAAGMVAGLLLARARIA